MWKRIYHWIQEKEDKFILKWKDINSGKWDNRNFLFGKKGREIANENMNKYIEVNLN